MQALGQDLTDPGNAGGGGVSVTREAAAGPVAEFCAALRQLRRASGADPVTLARQLGLSRTQLYAILAGEVKRPPAWDRGVPPLGEAWTAGAPAGTAWAPRP